MTSLQLSPAEMRALGYRAVDIIVDHVETLRGRRVANQVPRTQLDAALGDFSEEPADPQRVLSLVEREVMDGDELRQLIAAHMPPAEFPAHHITNGEKDLN